MYKVKQASLSIQGDRFESVYPLFKEMLGIFRRLKYIFSFSVTLSYPEFVVGMIINTLEVRPSRIGRTQ